MKWLAGAIFTIFLSAVYFTIKISSSALISGSPAISEVESNSSYKNELQKFNESNNSSEKQIMVNHAKLIKNINPLNLTTTSESELPDDLRNYIQSGMFERSLLQFAGVYGARVPLQALKATIPTEKWQNNYLVSKMNEVLSLPTIIDDPITRFNFVVSMSTMSETRDDAIILIKDSIKDMISIYQESVHEGDNIESAQQLHSQLMAAYIIIGVKNPEEAITSGGELASTVQTLHGPPDWVIKKDMAKNQPTEGRSVASTADTDDSTSESSEPIQEETTNYEEAN